MTEKHKTESNVGWKQKKTEKESKLREKIKHIAESYIESPEKIADFLSFSAGFHNYSPRNVMLIQAQNPGAMLLKPYAGWKNEGINVRRGEKAVQIFVPAPVTLVKTGEGEKDIKMLSHLDAKEKAAYENGDLPSRRIMRYKIGSIFDIAQTDFPKEKYPELLGIGESSLSYHEKFEKLKMYSEKELSCPVSRENLHSIGVRGFYHSGFNCIKINELLEDTASVSTLSHEIGHALLHKERPDYSTERKEFEADCVSIMIDSHLGLEIPDSRKAHLASHFEKLKEQLKESDISIDDIFSDVFEVYQKQVEKIDEYMTLKVPEIGIQLAARSGKDETEKEQSSQKNQKDQDIEI